MQALKYIKRIDVKADHQIIIAPEAYRLFYVVCAFFLIILIHLSVY